MTPPVLKFGTDGWRAIIGDTYTFENVGRVAAATAAWLHEKYGDEPTVVLGHDTRFQGRAFAEHAARVLAGAGIRVIFGKGITATPAVSWATKEYGCQAGVVLTASHNPPAWNGYKIKADTGGPAVPAQIAEVEALIPDRVAHDLAPFDSDLIEIRDVRSAYLDMLRTAIDVAAIREAGITVVHDAMFGAGQGMLSAVLSAPRVVELRSDLNPGFRGIPPEPIERNLSDLPEAVLRHGAAAAVANDGDADRIGMVDDKGRFVDSHRLLALLLWYLHEERGLNGLIVKTFSTTDMLDRMAEEYGLPITTTPIGFKYVCEYFLNEDVLVGGEESGGIAVKGHLPERDGIYVGLLVLEMVVKSGKPLSQLVDMLFERFGPHAYYRSDAHTSAERKEAALATLGEGGGLKSIAGHPVRSLETLDGFKHRVDDAWVLVRPSGTEPVLRVYAEAPTAAEAKALVEDTVRQLGV
ncbi:MAG: phosphoglucomutase/phosphomannomutase family protein [Rhodothermales bacterium]|nr:phosphoglucomutase/phosphomannomutase family protein [Rhodothermales bacterium]